MSETFTNYIGGLPTAAGVNPTDSLYLRQSGISKQLPASVFYFTQGGTGAVQRALSAKLLDSVWVSVTDFGADPTGVADSTAAIQNAINSLPAAGGIVYFPPGVGYTISSTITIGNGSTAAQSTQAGIYLVGAGNVQGNTSIFWAGPVQSNQMFVFQGPMKGWGLRNFLFNGNNKAGGALKLIACSNGVAEHFATINCTGNNVALTALASAATGTANTQFNTFNDYQIFVSNVASTTAMLLDGNGTNANANTSLNEFHNGEIVFPTASTAMNGYYLRDMDGNIFTNATVVGGGSGTTAIVFDYSGSGTGAWPSNNTFISFDPDGLTASAIKYSVIGSPSSIARPNRFQSLIDANGANWPKLNNTTYPAEFVSPGVDLAAQTVSIGATNITPIALYVTGMYRIIYYLEITTTGNAVNVSVTFGWTDDSGQAQTLQSALISANAKNFTQGTVMVRAASGGNITYLTTVSAAIGAGLYALHVKLEKLD